MNTLKTFLLMFGLLALMMFIGNLLGGQQGMFAFFIIGLVINFVTYWFSDKIVLKMYSAREVSEAEFPQIYRIARNLTQRAGMPMPKIYIIDTPLPNAFATGRNPSHAAVAVTTGILNILNEEELTAVLGHELSHVKNRDILIGTIAAAVAGAITMLSRSAMWFGYGRHDDDRGGGNPLIALLVAILAPIAAMIIQMAISRSREYEADHSGAELTGKPLELASALKKLEAGVKRNPAEVHPATAHLFIVSPLSGRSVLTLFSTHPPTAKRVKRLEEMVKVIY